MTQEQQVCIIIGASHAGAQLATSLRKEGWAGRIIVIGDETQLPYHRPPLSKALLVKEKTPDQIEIFKATVYEKANVEFRLGLSVEKIAKAFAAGAGGSAGGRANFAQGAVADADWDKIIFALCAALEKNVMLKL